MTKDDDTTVTLEYKGRSVTTTAGEFERLSRGIISTAAAREMEGLTREAVKDHMGLPGTAGGPPRIKTPDVMLVDLVCPECGILQTVQMEVEAVLTVADELDGGKVAKLSAKTKAQKVGHLCRQQTLDHAENEAVKAAQALLDAAPDGSTITLGDL